MLYDTGSSALWFATSQCTTCGGPAQTVRGTVLTCAFRLSPPRPARPFPRAPPAQFNSGSSSTFKSTSGTFSEVYGKGNERVSGVLGYDNVTVGGSLVPVKLLGLATQASGVPLGAVGFSGIAGLSPGTDDNSLDKDTLISHLPKQQVGVYLQSLWETGGKVTGFVPPHTS